jgi:hypothetical protein
LPVEDNPGDTKLVEHPAVGCLYQNEDGEIAGEQPCSV